MQKLMICAIRWIQSTPKDRAISWICPPPPASANTTRAFMTRSDGRTAARPLGHRAQWHRRLLHEEQGVEHDRLGEGDGEDRLDQDLGGRARVAADGVGGFHAD